MKIGYLKLPLVITAHICLKMYTGLVLRTQNTKIGLELFTLKKEQMHWHMFRWVPRTRNSNLLLENFWFWHMVNNESVETVGYGPDRKKMGLGLVKICLQRLLKSSMETSGIGYIPLIFKWLTKIPSIFAKYSLNALKFTRNTIFLNLFLICLC